MTAARLFSGAALALALAGCATSGPDYHPPENSITQAPSAQGDFLSANAAAFESAPLPDRWWHLYDDARLDGLVEEALLANADLRAADANLRRADALLRETAGQRAVATTTSANLSEERDFSTASAGTSLPGVATYDLGLSLSYPLDLNGKLRRAIEAGEADRAAVEAARDTVRIGIAAATTRAYANVCAANYEIATVRNVVAIQEKTLEATRRLQSGGRGTAFDVSRARTAVESSKASLPELEAARRNALYLLATLLGRPPAEFPRDVADCAVLPRLSAPIPVGDGAALIRRRPDIREAERTIAADTARVGVAMADLYPQISIGGGLITSGKAEDIGTSHSIGFGFGPLLSWSFPNRPLVEARIDAANAQVDADLAVFDSVVLQALGGTESALETYARGIERADALGRAADSARLSAGQAETLFRFGRSDFLSLLNAQGTLADAEVQHAMAEAELVDRQIAVFLALGGGWGDDPQS